MTVEDDNFRPYERIAFVAWAASVLIPLGWVVYKVLTEGTQFMKVIVYGFAILSLLFASLLAHSEEDPLRIAGGPRQLFDASTCSVYRPVWEEFDTEVLSIPAVYEYGPEALIPPAPADNTFDPVATEAVWLWADFASLNSLYSGRQPTPPAVGLPPILGYDQLYETFAIAVEGALGGPKLRMPHPIRGEDQRSYRVRLEVWVLSWSRRYSQGQLDRMREVMLRAPTCGGVTY